MTARQTSRVLLVDDTEQNRYVLSRILARAGLEVEQCTTGKEALERVKSCPDLVILDVKLPDLSGYEVCRRIKTDPVTRSVPVLQISASFVSNESKVQALEGGADGYLTHPIDATVLVATVKSLLRLKQAELISRQSAQQWQSTVDALPEYLVLLDTENKVVRCNRAFVELSGKTFNEVIGHDGVAILEQVLGSADFLTHTETSRYVAEQQHGQTLVSGYGRRGHDRRSSALAPSWCSPTLLSASWRKKLCATRKSWRPPEGWRRPSRMKSITRWKR